jgi:hypothetical protein
VDTFVTLLAVGSDASVDGADGARCALPITAGCDGGGPGDHRVDRGGGLFDGRGRRGLHAASKS